MTVQFSCRHYLPVFIPLLFSTNLIGQSDKWPMTRQLRVISENTDSIIWKEKYDKNGLIKKLSQEYFIYRSEEVFTQYETYKKDDYWFVWELQETISKSTDRYDKYKYIKQGPSLSYDSLGRLTSVYLYENGKELPHYYLLTYYSNGQLKDVFEYRKNDLYNIVEYYYPDGEPYDYGNFRDGNGQFIDLNDDGEPCVECNMKRGIPKKATVLCDDLRKK